jgi:hypothetical protein
MNMKKYLLVVFGQFTNEMCQDMALTMSPVVDSPHLKFQFTPGASILHFASEVDQLEIHEFLCGVFYGLASTFILTELTDKVSVNMPKKYSDHLFDLENDDEPSTIRLNSNSNLSENDMEEDNNFVALLLDEIKSKVSKPSLDSILDKIKSKGINSLTQFEKDTLAEYSK